LIPTKPDIQTNIVGLESNRFSIEITDKSFRVLIDGLYTNKVRSIIRELWTNAYDAHVAGGCPERPFTCTLPSAIEPVFSVRDYGCSMSHDDIMHLYSTVFASTKTATNDQVGCLGLGSKSPFAYTDSFTVIAYSGDEKRVYIAALDSDGIPIITHLSSEPSDEERGLEVSFAVDNSHIAEFRTEAKAIGDGFAIKPLIEGMDFTVDLPVFEADGFSIFKSEHYRSAWGVKYYIKQGVVIYPVPSEISTPNLLKGQYYCVVDVPIGSVEFAASRESLQITDKTRDFVTSTIKANMDMLVATARLDIKNKPNKLEAWKAFCEWSDIMNEDRINDAWEGNYKFHAYSYELKIHDMNVKVWNGKTIESIHSTKDTTARFSRDAVENGIFVINRGENMARRLLRFKEFDKNNSNVFWLDHPTNKHLERISRCLGVTPDRFISLKDIPDVAVPERTATDPTALQGVTLIHSNASNSYTSWSYKKITDVDNLPKKWCYIPIASAKSGQEMRLSKLKYRVTFNPNARWVDSNLPNLIDGLKTLKNDKDEPDFDYEVVFVSPRAIKKLGLDDDLFGLVNVPKFEDVAYDLIKSHRDEIYDARMAAKNRTSSIYYNNEAEKALGMSKAASSISHTIIHLDLPEIWAGLDSKAGVDYAEKYPLLFTNTPTMEQIQEYIDFIDSKENK
jgi:hypothetical protein